LVIPAYGDLESALIRGNYCGRTTNAPLTAIEALDDTGYRARHLSEIHVSPTLGVIVAENPVNLSKGKDAIPSPLIRPTA